MTDDAKKPSPTLSRVSMVLKAKFGDGSSTEFDGNSHAKHHPEPKPAMPMLIGFLDHVVMTAALCTNTDGQEIIDNVTATVNRIRTLKGQATSQPAVWLTAKGEAYGRVSDEQVLAVLEGAIADVKRRSGL